MGGDIKVCPLYLPSTTGSSAAPTRREERDTGEQIKAKRGMEGRPAHGAALSSP